MQKGMFLPTIRQLIYADDNLVDSTLPCFAVSGVVMQNAYLTTL
jgi:hypothetical protein